MATTEINVLLRGVDGSGNAILTYPITTVDNVVGLTEYVDGKRLHCEVQVPASGWQGECPYTQEISITGILDADRPHYGFVPTVENFVEEYNNFRYIDLLVTENDKIILVCIDEKPDIDLTIQIEVNR